MMTKDEKLMKLICGNIGDDFALKNICEAQETQMEELSEEERDFMIHTNAFYNSAEEFYELHEADTEYFQSLLDDGIIVRTSGGFVYKNCV